MIRACLPPLPARRRLPVRHRHPIGRSYAPDGGVRVRVRLLAWGPAVRAEGGGVNGGIRAASRAASAAVVVAALITAVPGAQCAGRPAPPPPVRPFAAPTALPSAAPSLPPAAPSSTGRAPRGVAGVSPKAPAKAPHSRANLVPSPPFAYPSGPTPAPPGGDGRLAGNAAGEGRTHPGRATDPVPSEEPSDDAESEADDETASAEPVPGGSPSATQRTGGRADAARTRHPGTRPVPEDGRGSGADGRGGEQAAYEDRVMRVLPLGTGMMLTGLGLGFIALRLRRTG